MTQFTRKLLIQPSGRKEWAVTGEYGSLSFWFVEHTPERKESLAEEGYGGVETHYNEKSRPLYAKENPDNIDCHINGGKCWHDGTSLWASEYWIPHVMPHGDEYIWRTLERHYDLKNREAEE